MDTTKEDKSGREKKEKGYFKTSFLIVAILCIGPLALPLLWSNPRFSLAKKVIISLLVLILSCYLLILFAEAFKLLTRYN